MNAGTRASVNNSLYRCFFGRKAVVCVAVQVGNSVHYWVICGAEKAFMMAVAKSIRAAQLQIEATTRRAVPSKR